MSSKQNQSSYDINKRWITNSFSHAASSYDDVAFLQKEVANRLVERLDLVTLQPTTVLDVGSGTGYCGKLINQRYPSSHLYSLDIAHGMLVHAKQSQGFFQKLRKNKNFICGDAENLPVKKLSTDLLISSLAIQWFEDLGKAFTEFYSVLKPGGLLMFSSLGPDTLRELRQAWATVDDYVHVSAFFDMHDVGDALMRAGFSDPVMDVETITLTYKEVDVLMSDLKSLGSRNAARGRPKGLTGKKKIENMKQAYEKFRQNDVLPATYEIVYGHAWVPEHGIQPSNLDNAFPIPVRAKR